MGKKNDGRGSEKVAFNVFLFMFIDHQCSC